MTFDDKKVEKIKNQLTGIRQKRQMNVSKVVPMFLIFFGSLSLLISIIFVSSPLAFIGLSLIFWGALFFYIRPQGYVKKDVLFAALSSNSKMITNLMHELGFDGKPIFIPPNYPENPDSGRVYIPKQEGKFSNEQIMSEDATVPTANGIFLSSPGCQLVRLIENSLNVDLTKTDIPFLTENLKRTFKDLELSENFDLQLRDEIIKIQITNSSLINDNFAASNTFNVLGCPLCSALACILTKTIQKPLVLEKIQVLQNGNKIDLFYRTLEKSETVRKRSPFLGSLKNIPSLDILSKLMALVLTVSGSVILTIVAILTYYDLTYWGKELSVIFFGSRTDEILSLGIGLTVMNYLLLSFAFLFLGFLAFFINKRKKWA
ncbi:MAG: hypothetical protein JW702_07260 [Clostridiales bacterium]|nr:hypothetical protein [Clostridiales bacterium]